MVTFEIVIEKSPLDKRSPSDIDESIAYIANYALEDADLVKHHIHKKCGDCVKVTVDPNYHKIENGRTSFYINIDFPDDAVIKIASKIIKDFADEINRCFTADVHVNCDI